MHERMRGESLSVLLAAPVFVRSAAVTINGNREGRTDFDHRAMPSAQAAAYSFGDARRRRGNSSKAANAAVFRIRTILKYMNGARRL